MTDNNTNDESIDKAEFDERLTDMEEGEPEADPEDLPEIMDFSDLLEMREDLIDIEDGLDQSAGYWAQVTIVLEQQQEAAEQLGESEKKAAIESTIEKARTVAERIDGGEALEEMREEIAAQDE